MREKCGRKIESGHKPKKVLTICLPEGCIRLLERLEEIYNRGTSPLIEEAVKYWLLHELEENQDLIKVLKEKKLKVVIEK